MNERSSGVALLAAVFSLGAVPVGALIFALASKLPESWLEGGVWMYALLLLALIASVVNAVGVYFSARGSPAVLGGGLLMSMFTALVSVLAFRSVLSGSFEAITHAAPDDQSTIMFGASGEALQLAVFGCALVGGLFLSLALSSALLAVNSKTHRAAFACFGLGIAAIGAWQSAVRSRSQHSRRHSKSSSLNRWRTSSHCCLTRSRRGTTSATRRWLRSVESLSRCCCHSCFCAETYRVSLS